MAKTRRESKREAIAPLESSRRSQMQAAAGLGGSALPAAPAADRADGWLPAKAIRRRAGPRAGCCYDIAPMESYFHALKVELARQRRWSIRDEARRDLFAYIEGNDTRRRPHSAPGSITLDQAELNAS